MKARSIISLAAVLGFNAGMAAAPACAGAADASLITAPAKAETFVQRMARIRAAKRQKKPTAPRAHKTRAAKAPKIPTAPKIPSGGF
jgi:hypothetical protein